MKTQKQKAVSKVCKLCGTQRCVASKNECECGRPLTLKFTKSGLSLVIAAKQSGRLMSAGNFGKSGKAGVKQGQYQFGESESAVASIS